MFVYRLYVCFPIFEFGLHWQCVLVSGAEGWAVGRRGRGVGQGTNYTSGCIYESSMQMMIEKVLIDRMSVIQVDFYPGFINVQFLSCFHMIAHLCYVYHRRDVFSISKGMSVNYNMFCKLRYWENMHTICIHTIHHSWWTSIPINYAYS